MISMARIAALLRAILAFSAGNRMASAAALHFFHNRFGRLDISAWPCHNHRYRGAGVRLLDRKSALYLLLYKPGYGEHGGGRR